MAQPVDEADEQPSSRLRWQRRALAVVDVVESVRLMQAGEADVIERWRAFIDEVRAQVLPVCQGRLVKSLGDGMLLDFKNEPSALAAARTLQRRVPQMNQGHAEDKKIELRIGIHAAEVVVDDIDVFGAGVNLAARLAGLAGPGQIVFSHPFWEAVQGHDPLEDAEDLGLCYLKHLDEPVHAWRVLTASPALVKPAHRIGAAAAGGRSASQARGRLAAPDVLVSPACVVFAPEPAGADHEDRIVAELLGDGLAARLTVSSSVRVISRWSARSLDTAHRPGALVWSALRAHYAVRGHLHRLGGRLVAALELVDSSNDQLVWAGRRSFDTAELLSSDDELTAELADQIARHIDGDRLRKSRTAALPALDSNQLQLSAATLMFQAGDEPMARSQLMLDHLIERHPREPSPRSWAAMWYVLQVTRGFEHEPERVANRALDHVHRALDHDPDSALAHAMAGFVHTHLRHDLAAAEKSLAAAVDANPSEPWAWLFRSVVAGYQGRGDDAWDWATRATMLSPRDPMRHYFDGLRSNAASIAGRYADAVRLARRSLAVNPHHPPTSRGLVISLVHLGQIEEARLAMQRAMEAEPGFTVAHYLASAPPDGLAMRRVWADALLRAGAPLH